MQVSMKDGTVYKKISKVENIGNSKIAMSWDNGCYHEVERDDVERTGPDEEREAGSNE